MKKMTCGISVYSCRDQAELEKAKSYISLAAKLGYCEVFSSLHQPEHGMEVFDTAAELGRHIQSLSMDFCLDISGKKFMQLMSEQSGRAALKKIPISWLRMDYGFSDEAIFRAARELNVKGVMCNASVLEADRIEWLAREVRDGLGITVRAHHNFYPRPETGISLGFMCEKSKQYLPYGIEVTACVAAHSEPRGPLFAGLPTVESQRYMDIAHAALELRATGLVNSILIGDPYASEQELLAVAGVCRNEPIRLRVEPADGICEAERQILLSGAHHARPDEAECSIRSQSSREMASFGALIPARAAIERKRYDITIDNEKYLRYSGELQLLKRDLPVDERVNTVARVCPSDQPLVELIRPGDDFIFVCEDN